jgi:uncharacterized protein YacL
MNFILARTVFFVLCCLIGAFIRPLGLEPLLGALSGAAVAAAMISAEFRVRTVPFQILAGSFLGFLSGFGVGVLLSYSLEKLAFFPSESILFSVQVLLLLTLGYIGFAVGARKGEELSLRDLQVLFKDGEGPVSHKILDTSVIIDGRIADLCETGFLEGVLVLPQFILRELQSVADSSDSQKRNRGRRGLDILHRIQKIGSIEVQITEEEYTHIKEVDLKLIEQALDTGAKIVTNDFNLNKVCQLRGVGVLNINELANALKPVVLPGEGMKVFILKEGKDASQGVAYLDDGTMVVVDHARKYIGKTIDIIVTSVLQTTAGKMIFGRYEALADEPAAEGGEEADRRARRRSNGGGRNARSA